MDISVLLKLSAALHVIGVVLWIGGVAFVTLVLLPLIHAMEDPLQKALVFQGAEHRFARIVRGVLAVVAVTGLFNLHAKGLYSLMATPAGWWLDLMIGVLVAYALLIFGLEKALFKRIFKDAAKMDPGRVFRRMIVFHWVVLALSLLAVAGGVWGTY